jgi:hypothetical protein
MTPLLSFEAKRGDQKLEADLALYFSDEFPRRSATELMFVECKSYDVFEQKDMNRMQALAQRHNAKRG